MSTQLRNILAYFEIQRGGRSLPVLIARQNVDGTEIEFSNMLVEDANNEGLSYPDYLCAVHAAIQSRQEGEKGGDGGNTSMCTHSRLSAWGCNSLTYLVLQTPNF